MRKKTSAKAPKFKVLEVDEADKLLPLPDWRRLRGYDAEINKWRALIQTQRLPQVMLLHGRSGLGKSHLLSALTALMLCETRSACGLCGSCLAVLGGAHDEVLWLDSQTGKYLLDDAALLQEHLSFAPAGGAVRVAVIVDAEQMTVQAANRLLKTLEEPNPGARILLSSSRVGAILPTILSRCVKWRIAPPPADLCRTLVDQHLGTLGLDDVVRQTVSDDIVRRSGLAPGLALRLCEDFLAAGVPGASALSELLKERDPERLLTLAERVARESGLTVAMILQEWEIELNKVYREEALGVEPKTESRASPAQRARRRDVLREAKRLAVHGKVPLNAQLTAEGLALAGLL